MRRFAGSPQWQSTQALIVGPQSRLPHLRRSVARIWPMVTAARRPETQASQTAQFRRGWTIWRWPMSRALRPVAAKLEDYLRRKLRERGWEGEGDPPVRPRSSRGSWRPATSMMLAYARAEERQPAAARLWPAADRSGAACRRDCRRGARGGPRRGRRTTPRRAGPGAKAPVRAVRSAELDRPARKSRSPQCSAPGTRWTWSVPFWSRRDVAAAEEWAETSEDDE